MATNKTKTALVAEVASSLPIGTPAGITSTNLDALVLNMIETLFGTTLSTSITDSASPYTLDIDATRWLLCNDASGAITVNLPAVATYPNRVVTITKLSASNSVTIDGNASETINGATTLVLSGQYDSVTIANNGTAWYVQSSHSL